MESVVPNTSKILKRKQITTAMKKYNLFAGCSQYVKDTKKKANHNACAPGVSSGRVVPNTSKILKRKQITTNFLKSFPNSGCSQYVKDTKKKANHNEQAGLNPYLMVVPNTSKILKRKQITTEKTKLMFANSCSQYVKDTKKKANHNTIKILIQHFIVVPNTSKILKRKQITTVSSSFGLACELFPIRQRY